MTSLWRNMTSCSSQNDTREYYIPVPWGKIAVKEWGSEDGLPIVGLHGWSDNVNTFDHLAPLIPSKYRFIAFDFSGHGLSSHRPFGCYYGWLEFCSDIVRVVDYLKLDKFSMVGHSLGARLCFFFADIYPKRVSKIVSLDDANPPHMSLEDLPFLMQSYIREDMKYESLRFKEPPSFLPDEALELMMDAGMSKMSAEVLMARGFRKNEDGSRLIINRDPRLRSLLPILGMSFNVQSLIHKRYNQDLLLFLTSNATFQLAHDPDGSYREAFAKNCRIYKFVTLEGSSHHIHIEEPEKILPHLIEFLEEV